MALIHHVIDGVPREADVPEATVEIHAEAGWSPGPWPGARDDFGRPVADEVAPAPQPPPDNDDEE
jgi:hypothetical protein